MNKLYVLKNMGFTISWKLIAVGLFGADEIPASITQADAVEYLKDILTGSGAQTDDIIQLICAEDDAAEFSSILKKLAEEDPADATIQKRKWRACLLALLLESSSNDPLQGMLELTELWAAMGMPADCPQDFPADGDQKAIRNYFTQASYESSVSKNRAWLEGEILRIRGAESVARWQTNDGSREISLGDGK